MAYDGVITIRGAYPNELYHHGIKGQKWGVRRFQNPDGTLTAAGKKRYNKYTTVKKDYEAVRKNLDRYTKLTEEGDKKAAKQVLRDANKYFKIPVIVGLTTGVGGTYKLNDKLHSLKRKEIKYAEQLGKEAKYTKYTKVMKHPILGPGLAKKDVLADFEVFKDLKTDEERLNYLLYMYIRARGSGYNSGYGAGYGAGSVT